MQAARAQSHAAVGVQLQRRAARRRRPASRRRGRWSSRSALDDEALREPAPRVVGAPRQRARPGEQLAGAVRVRDVDVSASSQTSSVEAVERRRAPVACLAGRLHLRRRSSAGSGSGCRGIGFARRSRRSTGCAGVYVGFQLCQSRTPPRRTAAAADAATAATHEQRRRPRAPGAAPCRGAERAEQERGTPRARGSPAPSATGRRPSSVGGHADAGREREARRPPAAGRRSRARARARTRRWRRGRAPCISRVHVRVERDARGRRSSRSPSSARCRTSARSSNGDIGGDGEPRRASPATIAQHAARRSARPGSTGARRARARATTPRRAAGGLLEPQPAPGHEHGRGQPDERPSYARAAARSECAAEARARSSPLADDGDRDPAAERRSRSAVGTALRPANEPAST